MSTDPSAMLISSLCSFCPSNRSFQHRLASRALLLISTFLGVACLGSVGAAERVVVDPAASMIVVPDKPDSMQQVAADELRLHLKLITGVNVPIRNAAAAGAAAYTFFIGIIPETDAVPFRPEDARWRIGEEDAYFYGANGSRGVVFAVCAFLEEQLGVRWLRPGNDGIVYDTQRSLTLAAGSFNWAPELELRKIRPYRRPGRGYPVRKDYVVEYEAFMPTRGAHDKEAHELAKWQMRMRMGGHSDINYGHAFIDWWDRYAIEHPDYFALNRWGKREPELRVDPGANPPDWTEKDRHSIKVCVSNPGVAKQTVDNWMARGKRTKWLNACMNDQVWGFCRCADCLALDRRDADEKLGEYLYGLSDRYVHLANEVARQARAIDPGAGSVMYAYETTEAPPRHTKVEPNVVVAMVPTTVDLSKLTRLFGHWSRAGATKMLMRPNYPLYYNALALPVGCEKQMYDAFQVAYGFGVVAVDYDSLTGMWPYCGMSDYVLAHTFADPEKSFEHWEEHYCSAYGPAAEDVRAYYAYWRYELWDRRLRPDLNAIVEKGRYHNFARGLLWSLGDDYRESDFDATDAILEKAAARDLRPRQREMLDELIVANRQARLLVKAVTTPGIAKFEHAQRLLAFRTENRERGAFNWFIAFANESRYGDMTGTKIAQRLQKYPLPWVETALAWQFRLDPNDVGLKEKWEQAPWEEVKDWDRLRTDFFWDNPYDSETDPALTAKLKGYDGIGWYATRQSIPEEMKGRKLMLYFGAVDESCWVYVNGKLAGTHLFKDSNEWRTSFEIRIDEFIDWERSTQQFTVRVEDKAGAGGIWKRVWLVSASE